MPMPESPVRKRHVLFIQGFDPRGPAVFHGIAVREAAKASAISGTPIEIGPRKGGGTRWRMTASFDGMPVETDYEVLRWDDLVRRMWIKGELQLLWRALRWIEISHRRGLLAASKGPALALHRAILVPGAAGVCFLGAILLGMVLLAALGMALSAAVGWPALAGALLALPLALGARSLWRRLDQHISICWINRAFGYILDHATGKLDEAAIAERHRAFARRIVEVERSGTADEILVVGHSIGSMHAAEALAAAVALEPDLGKHGPSIALVTLGQCIPVPLLLRDDTSLHHALAQLAGAPQISWLDATALSDPASSCGMDPMQTISAPRRPDFPLSRPPAFHEILTPETHRYIKRRPVEFHFQYLKASEREAGYDFFRLVLGPQPVFAKEQHR